MCDNEFTIFQYVEGELDKNDEAKLINHLAECEDCRKILSDYVDMKNQAGAFYKTVKQDSIVAPETKAIKTKFTFRRIVAYSAAAAIVIIGFLLIAFPVKENDVINKSRTDSVTEVKTGKTENNILLTENKPVKKIIQSNLKRKIKRKSYDAFITNQKWRTEADTIMSIILSMQKTFEQKPL